MNRLSLGRIATAGLILAAIPVGMLMQAQQPDGAQPGAAAQTKKKGGSKGPPRPGVSTPGVKREIAGVKPLAVFETGGTPDWQVLTDDAVWVANGPLDSIFRLDVKTNKIAATVAVGKRPCSGLTAGFGSIWVPSCGDKTLGRVDVKTNSLAATLPIAPAESEGGIATSDDAVWLVTDWSGKETQGRLSRIDPKTNSVVAEIEVPQGSAAVVYGDGAVWVTSPAKSVVTRVDARTNKVTDTISTGPGPRFETFGGGAVWTLNQGDGTISRVDTKTRKVAATIEVGIPGSGGEIAYGLGHVWATVFQIPISEIDPSTNQVVRQWTGDGGDSIRAGHGSVFLSNLRAHNVYRIDPSQLQQ
jgi:virginiamycin B lyase